MLAFKALDQSVLQGVEIRQTQALGQGIIDLGFARRLNFLHLGGEDCVFARQMRSLVFFGEGHFDIDLVACLGAHQLILEARDELARAQNQLCAFSGAALEFLAVDGADKVDHDLVAVSGLALFLFIGDSLLGQLLERLVNLFVRDLGDRTGELEGLGIDRVEFRHDLKADFEREIRAFLQNVFRVRLDVHRRLGRRADLALVQSVLGRLRDQLLKNVAHDRSAEHLADVVGGHLARAEALQAHFGTDLFDLGGQFGFELRRGHDNLKRAREPFSGFFNYVHLGEALLESGRRHARTRKYAPAAAGNERALCHAEFADATPSGGECVQPAPPVRENRIGGKRQMTPYQHHTCFNSIKTSAPFQ